MLIIKTSLNCDLQAQVDTLEFIIAIKLTIVQNNISLAYSGFCSTWYIRGDIRERIIMPTQWALSLYTSFIYCYIVTKCL